MRYYDLRVGDSASAVGASPPGGGSIQVGQLSSLLTGAATGTGSGSSSLSLRYTSHPNGTGQPPDPGALKAEFDVFAYQAAGTDINSWIRVWGIPLTTIGQASNLNGKYITLFGGMGKGLPLANPAQAGLLVSGQINQALGNWINNNMTLDIQLRPYDLSNSTGASAVAPLSLNWVAGQELSAAIQQTIAKAFPNAKTDVSVRSGLTQNHDEPYLHSSLAQFASYVQKVSQAIATPGQVYSQQPGSYPGVQIAVSPDGTFKVYDGSTQGTPLQLQFTDLIGQPTWFAPGQINVTCVMRSDVKIGTYVKLPQSVITTQTAAQSGVSGTKQSSIFQGSCLVNQVRHVGSYKEPSAEAWVTVLICSFIDEQNGSITGLAPPATTNLSSQSTENTPGA